MPAPTATTATTYMLTQDPSPGTPIEPTSSEIKQGPNPLPKLFQPLKIRSTTFKNRLWVSPMCMYSAEDGFINDFHLARYGQFAMHGAGAVLIEATGVLPEGRLTPKCLGVWKDEHITGLRRIVDYEHYFGAAVRIQLAHAGRKASTIPLSQYGKRPSFRASVDEGGWPEDVYGPSALAYDDNHWEPKEMTLGQIETVQQAFADAAVRADKAGFDFIEIHSAHGCLISSFNSPLSNHRTDKYGGSFENRTRFAVETVQRVRNVWLAEKPLFIRFSTTEWVEGGWTTQDSIKLAEILYQEGVDLVDCSSAGNDTRQKIPVGRGYQVPLATEVKNGAPGVLVGAVGIITDGEQANDILEQDKADAIFAGHEFLRDPTFALKAAQRLGVFVKWNDQYERGRPKTRHSFI
ncbi:NADH:flavin oxidoreductase/NADH oxidase [Linderina pennispora]|uniref:NADH:flavin oxidoreductase/NADH oxidase n=1 Tax=Linderina pennispora TaxID=61395 RepID=A0A1Y1W9H0_9FUNG|nr:NADH:flavin oxidoreductase/NADH oxidase [Linderina pennispora]ORX70187.1 NADH:flavin oxidoreductase/NADH oxidase [Linderina pennispora]